MAQLVCRKMVVQAAVPRRIMICALMLIYTSNCRQRWRLRGSPGYRIFLRNDAIHFEKILPITFSSVAAVLVITNATYLGIYLASIHVRGLRGRLLCPVLHDAGSRLLIDLVRVSAWAWESILLLLLLWMVGIVRLCCVLRMNCMLDWIPLHHLLLLWALRSLLLIMIELTGHYLASRYCASKRILLFVRHRSW